MAGLDDVIPPNIAFEKNKREIQVEGDENQDKINQKEVEEYVFDPNKYTKQINKIQKEALESEQDEDEGGRQETFSNLFYLLTSFVFIIIFVTQFDLTAQQRQSSLLLQLFDNQVFDFQTQHMRQSAGSAAEIFQYLKDYLIPIIYDEVQKSNNGYVNTTQNLSDRQNLSMENSTDHFLGYFTYYVGMRFSLKRQRYVENQELNSKKVLPQIIPYNFQKTNTVDDYSDPIPSLIPNYGNYIYEQGEGPNYNGAYTVYFEGQLTYKQAKAQLFDLQNVGFFNESNFLYLGVEILTYNEGYKSGGFTIFEFYRTSDGSIYTLPSLYKSIFPNENRVITGPSLIKQIVIFIYIIGLLIQTIQLLYAFYKYVREYIRRKELNIQWYDYIDTLAQAFCLQSMYYWFVLYARKDQFSIPIDDMSQFVQQIDSCYYIAQYLNSSSIAVVLLCIKNLRILMIFFPSFGVLFDTFRRAKLTLFYFFAMSLTFMVGFLFAGNILFGPQDYDYMNVSQSLMALFRMLVGEFKYQTLESANPEVAIIFFMVYVVFFFIILLNLLLTIVIMVYDSLRSKKALDSMARAKIIQRENYEYFQKWMNLILCRMGDQTLDTQNSKNLLSKKGKKKDPKSDKTSKSGTDNENMDKKVRFSDQENGDNIKSLKNNSGQKTTNNIQDHKVDDALNIIKRQQLIRERQEGKNHDKKKDLKTICLHNKAKLFQSSKSLKTKENYENEMNIIKRQIILKKIEEREARIKRFQTVDIKGVIKLKSSIVYLMFIINFVVMITLQLQITQSGQAQQSLRWVVDSQTFTDLQLYLPFDPNNTIFQEFPTYIQQIQSLPNNTFSDIFMPTQLEDWLYQSLFQIIYNNTDQTILRQNHLFGDYYVRISYRKLRMRNNQDDVSKSVISQYRVTELLQFGTGVDPDEVTKDFYGSRSGRLYKYEKPGSIRTYNQDGGFVILLPSDQNQAQEILFDIVNDNLLDQTFATLAIEFVTFNTGHKAFQLTSLTFQQQSSGLVITNQNYRVIRKNLYANSLDYFRGSQEIIYACMVLFYLSVEIRDFVADWIKIVKIDNQFFDPVYSQDSPNLFERLCVFLGINYFYLIHKNFIILFLYLIYYSLRWCLKQFIRFFRVLFRYISSDFFKLFNIVSICISLTLIGTWFTIILDDDFHVNKFGKITQTQYNQIDLLSNLGVYYDTYNFYSSINCIIIFWRILQFFSFSYRLSAFTEILSASKNDVFFFMLMFIICLFGYAVMGYSIYGQNSQNYSNLFYTIIELFKMMVEYFDYDSMVQWNPSFAPAFFVSYMLLFDQFMKNMFIAIIMAHYNEFQSFSGNSYRKKKKERKNPLDLEFLLEMQEKEEKLIGSGFNQIIDLKGQKKNKTQQQQKQLVFSVFKSFLLPEMFSKIAKKNDKGFIKWYADKWDGMEKFLLAQKLEVDDDLMEAEIFELERTLQKKYLKPEYDKEQLHKFVLPFLLNDNPINQNQIDFELKDDELNQNIFPQGIEQTSNGQAIVIRQLNESNIPGEQEAPDNRFQFDNEESKKHYDLQKEYDMKYGGDNSDNQVLMQNYISIIPENLDGIDDDDLASSNVWVAALEKMLFHQSQKTILYSDFYEPEDLLSIQDHSNSSQSYDDTPIYDIEQFSLYQTEFLMKDFHQRTQVWRKARTIEKYKLWLIMDFEKTFEDENKFREEYGERLETFLELINQMNKDLEEWEKKQREKNLSNDADQEELESQEDMIYSALSARQKELDRLKKQIVKEKQDLIKEVPVMTFKKINRSPELQDPDFSRASLAQKYLWINCTSRDEKFLLWFNFFTPFYRTKLWNSLCFSEDYLISIINTQKFFRQDLALRLTNKLQDIKIDYIQHLQEKLQAMNNQKESDMASTMHKKANLEYKNQKDKLQRKIDKMLQNKKKLEDIAKQATYEIRQKHLNPLFFLQCLELLQSRKFKQYKKLRSDPNSKRLFDALLLENEILKEEELKEKIKLFSKRRNITENMIISQPTIVKNPTIKTSVKDLNKDLNNGNSVKNSFSNSPTKPLENQVGSSLLDLNLKNQQNSVEQLSQQIKLKFNFSRAVSPNKSFEKSQNVSVFQGNHSRGSSQALPLINNREIVQSGQNIDPPNSVRHLLSNHDKFRMLTSQENDFRKTDSFRESAMRLKSLKSKLGSIDGVETFEIKKINSRVYVETLKQYFGLMIHGLNGDRLTYLNSNYPLKTHSNTSDNNDKKAELKKAQELKALRQRYLYLTQTLDVHEERMALWLTMSQDDKLRMLACQHIEGEAETMAMLLIEEIDRQPSALFKMHELDCKLERTLDNQIYEKYRRLTEWQALKTTSFNSDKRLRRLEEEDGGILGLIGFLSEKGKDLDNRARYLQKDVAKKYKENELWRQQYESKNKMH